MRAGLFGETTTDAVFCMGFVRSYNPSSKIYRISLDGKSEGVARPILSGADKPWPQGTRVACIRFATSGWLIMGEVEKSKAPTKERESPSGSVAQKDQELRDALHDRYNIDLADFGDRVIDPPLEGDAVLANRDDPRSYIQVYENGDILSLASNFCFSLLSRVKSLAVTWAKDFWGIFAGCSVKVTTDDSTKLATTEVSINSDPSDEADRDLDLVAGAISNSNRPTKNLSLETKGKTIAEGIWALLGTHALFEVDNEAKEVRLSKVAIQAGQDTFGKDVQFRMNEDQVGLVWGKNKLTLNDNLAALERSGRSIVLDDNRLALTWGADKFIVLTDKGIQISGMLELVGGQLKLNSDPVETSQVVVDGENVTVPNGTDGQANLLYQVSGNTIDISGSGAVSAINLNTDFSVRNFGLVDDRFLTKYDQDMTILKSHEHISTTPGSPTTPTGVLQAADQPPAATQKSSLTSKKA
jgi:hypothetical protein